MEKIVTATTAGTSTEGAIDLMGKLAVLIVAALLFAAYGIRDGRSQPVNPDVQAASQGKVERARAWQRATQERSTAAARTRRARSGVFVPS